MTVARTARIAHVLKVCTLNSKIPCLWPLSSQHFEPRERGIRAAPAAGATWQTARHFIDRHEVGQPNEFANWTDEELEAFIKSDIKPQRTVTGKTQH
jgi:hypothetical protein